MTARSIVDISIDVPAGPKQSAGLVDRAVRMRTARRLLAKGVVAARGKDFDGAIARFTQARSLCLNDPEIWFKSLYHRGCAFAGKGDYGRAIADFSQLLDSTDRVPSVRLDTQLYIHRGNAHRQLGHYKLAAADLERGIERSGGSAQSYGARGLLRLDVSECEGAIADFTQALKIHPTFAQCWMWRGFVWLRCGLYQRAVDDLSRAIESIPACAEAYNHRGVAHFYLQSFIQAQADFDQAIQLDRCFAEAYNNRGNVLQLMGEPAAATVDYHKAVSLHPQLAEIYFNRAAAVESSAEAAADYDQTAGLSSDNAAFYRHRGQIRFQTGQFAAAASDYTSAISILPTADAYYWRGMAYLELDKGSQALLDFDRAIALSPDDGRAYVARAQLRLKINNLEGALVDTDKAITLTASTLSSTLYVNRCMIQFCLNQREQAMRDFETLVSLFMLNAATPP